MTATAPSDAPARWAYHAPLDGLRAVAVVAVLAFHLDAGWAPGGFLGVDAFFVLSGFLITSLLLVEWTGAGTISLKAFWARRARRLLPALVLVLVAVAVYGAVALPSHELGRLRADLLSTLFYGANWRFVATAHSYFAHVTEASPLRHAWSLAIEEQFYVVWPLVVLGALRFGRGRRRLLVAVCALGGVASVVAMAATFDADDPSRSYFGTDTRAHLLLIGALLAVALERWHHRDRQARIAAAAGVAGAAAVVAAFALADARQAWLYHGGYALFGVAVAAVIWSVVTASSTPLSRALSVRPVVWLGRISYGVYLWHWPVILVMSPVRTGIDGAALTAARVAATGVLATLSFYAVERPVRLHAPTRGRWAGLGPAAALAAVAVVAVVATAGATAVPAYYRTDAELARSDADDPAPTAPAAQRVLLVGDSTALSLQPGLESVAGAAGFEVLGAARSGCGVVRGVPIDPDGAPIAAAARCDRILPALHERKVRHLDPAVVVWLSAWETIDRTVDGKRLEVVTPAGRRALAALVEEAADRLTARGAHLLLLVPAQSPPDTYLPLYDYDERLRRLPVLHELLEDYARRHPGSATLVDLGTILCPSGPPCPKRVAGLDPRPDGSHFGPDGARLVATQLVPPITDGLRRAAAEPETVSR